ncbi:hypothetical protein N7510_008224 [Penicillium lagena]|uniref:uncharacterized protein n=1 Tax=Penicillium lagena TaxID=94218 RepID=UPI0025418981|nr:uncharacterized protein N7510_008224 [Penicillium lagena]KAJ5605443.1 hypothetical protein N7510_008224 [Penicillium lagena]
MISASQRCKSSYAGAGIASLDMRSKVRLTPPWDCIDCPLNRESSISETFSFLSTPRITKVQLSLRPCEEDVSLTKKSTGPPVRSAPKRATQLGPKDH